MCEAVSFTVSDQKIFKHSSLAQSVEHLTVNQGVTGSSPVGGAIAPLAQLVEQLTLNQWVPGSNPWRCTTNEASSSSYSLLFCAKKMQCNWLLISPAANVALGPGFESLKVRHNGATILHPNTKVLDFQGLFEFLGVKNNPLSPLYLFLHLLGLNQRLYRIIED